MIGNDVIDLVLAKTESNWKRKGFLNKIFSKTEKELIHNSKNKFKQVWNLWSRKEAVYKIILQQNGARGFYPLKIENIDFEKGLVTFENQIYYVKTNVSKNKIHTVALLSLEFDKVKTLKNPNIIKKNHIPFIYANGKQQNISKSHHGKYEEIVVVLY